MAIVLDGLRAIVRVVFFVMALLVVALHSNRATCATLNYNRDIRPILADNCFRCHGPDVNERQGGVRLDSAEGAVAEADSGLKAVVPGRPEESELIRRIFAAEDELMPPPDSGKSLTAEQKATLRAWIAEGAKYERHWSFIPPQRPSIPKQAESEWGRNEIDYFVLGKLREKGLTPSPEADRRTLIRRASLDLTGLPPTPDEVLQFIADESADSYERLVERLLNSPRFGERMAIDWLDLARYADTDGYEKDSHRQMWPYRDWVINAFNRNMPFDEFTIEQLAGDMLPRPTRAQIVATAFNRNGPTTSESGSDPAEYAVKYAVDRVSTTSTVWLGLTMQCAECHDHKFDPLTTKDFYSFLAFFDQVPETPLYEGADSPPSIPVFSAQQESKATELDQRLVNLKHKLELDVQSLEAERTSWELDLATANVDRDASREGLIAEYCFDDAGTDSCHDSSGIGGQGRIEVGDELSSAPQPVTALVGRGYEFRGSGLIDCGPLSTVDLSRGISYGAWVKPTAHGGVVLSCTDPQLSGRGFDLYLQAGVAMIHVADRWPTAAVKLTTQSQYTADRWLHVMVVCDNGQGPGGVRIYFNGVIQPVSIDINAPPLSTVASSAPLRIGSRANGESPMHGTIDEVRIYNRRLSDSEVALVSQEAITRVARIPASERTPDQHQVIADAFRRNVVDPATSDLRAQIAKYQDQWDRLRSGAPMVRVMADVAERRPTHVLIRGDYRNPGEQVPPAPPASLGSLPDGVPANRLTLARWLTCGDNPLTSRVTVNRLWAMCFGVGIVKTVDDFGSQGEWPSHPELLDWLAYEFRVGGWDIKAMLRMIVTSSTYRQTSACSLQTRERDPDNRLLARGPRRRLPAEIIRDNALLIGGLLHEQIGGPSVFPYHPQGLWEEMAWADAPHKTWKQDHGPDLYRRGLYTFWKRSMIHPAFSVFDAPTRNVCAYARPTTNTPLQAFVTLNEPSYIEAARGLAGRTLTECQGSVEDRIAHMYLIALSRPPRDQETKSLGSLYRKALKRFRSDPSKSEEFLAIGDLPRPTNVDAIEYASWTIVAQALLNLDETVTNE